MNAQNNQNKEGGLSWSQPPREGGFKPAAAQKPTPQLSQKPAPAPALAQKVAAKPAGTTGKGARVALFAGGALLGLVLGAVIFDGEGRQSGPVAGGSATSTEQAAPGGATTEAEGTAEETAPASGAGAAGRDFFVVPPVQSAGFSVSVSQASVSGNSWIVVYESRNGERGNALGAALFSPERKSGTVRLLRTTIAGQTYFVGHRRDDGDRIFSMQKDLPVVGTNGEPVLVQFVAE